MSPRADSQSPAWPNVTLSRTGELSPEDFLQDGRPSDGDSLVHAQAR